MDSITLETHAEPEVVNFIPPHLWPDRVPLFSNTIIETVNGKPMQSNDPHDRYDFVDGELRLKPAWEGERGIAYCLYLCMLVNGEVTKGHRQRFGMVIASLIESGIAIARLTDPRSIPLTGLNADGLVVGDYAMIGGPNNAGPVVTPRTCLFFYFHTKPHGDEGAHGIRKRVNAFIGFEACIDEGGIPIVWP
jgi:hypothetical protein